MEIGNRAHPGMRGKESWSSFVQSLEEPMPGVSFPGDFQGEEFLHISTCRVGFGDKVFDECDEGLHGLESVADPSVNLTGIAQAAWHEMPFGLGDDNAMLFGIPGYPRKGLWSLSFSQSRLKTDPPRFPVRCLIEEKRQMKLGLPHFEAEVAAVDEIEAGGDLGVVVGEESAVGARGSGGGPVGEVSGNGNFKNQSRGDRAGGFGKGPGEGIARGRDGSGGIVVWGRWIETQGKFGEVGQLVEIIIFVGIKRDVVGGGPLGIA